MPLSDRDATDAASPTEDLEDLYENAPCGYLSLGPRGQIVRANATLAKWTGYAPGQLVGMRFHELLSIAGRVLMETQLSPLLRMQGFFDEIALDLVPFAGGKLPVIANAVERRDPSGAALFTRVALFKAVDRRRYERNIVDARAIAERQRDASQALEALSQENLRRERETSEMREQFIAVLGHDLRNPLAAITSGARLLSREPLSPKGMTILTLLQASTLRMSGLIDNVLDFARGRLGGGLTLSRDASEPLAPVLEQVVAELRVGAPDREVMTAISITRSVNCDRVRIAQMVSNLLGNAMTYGAHDSPVVLSASTEVDELEIAVVNGGKPISSASMEHLFEPFFRGEVRGTPQGLGLGLHIASEIAKAHGGTLTVSSSAEETRFIFRMTCG